MVASVGAMSNPASLLADQIQRWSVPVGEASETARGARENGGYTSYAFWAEHRRAIQYLLEVERSLDSMTASGTDVAHFRLCLPAWYSAVFSVHAPWGNGMSGGAALADDRDIAMLRALAQMIDTNGYNPVLDGPSVESLIHALDAAEELVRTSNGVDEPTRRYILGLVVEARDCARELDTFGNVQLRSVSFELGGAMSAVAANTTIEKPTRERWRDVRDQVVIGFALLLGSKAIDAAPGLIQAITKD